MPRIKVEFEYDCPDEWYSDSFALGRKEKFTYEGPEYITFNIDKNTGRENGWCMQYPEEYERAIGLDEWRVTVDCKEEPLLCEIANDQGREKDQDFYDNRPWKTLIEAPEGYESYEVPDAFHPRDIYDEYNISYDFDKDEFHIPHRTWKSVGDMDPDKMTWKHFRLVRNRLLSETDGMIDEDMPADVKQVIYDYRKILRDAPENLKNLTPHEAFLVIPPAPDMSPTGQEELEDAMVTIDDIPEDQRPFEDNFD